MFSLIDYKLISSIIFKCLKGTWYFYVHTTYELKKSITLLQKDTYMSSVK